MSNLSVLSCTFVLLVVVLLQGCRSQRPRANQLSSVDSELVFGGGGGGSIQYSNSRVLTSRRRQPDAVDSRRQRTSSSVPIGRRIPGVSYLESSLSRVVEDVPDPVVVPASRKTETVRRVATISRRKKQGKSKKVTRLDGQMDKYKRDDELRSAAAASSSSSSSNTVQDPYLAGSAPSGTTTQGYEAGTTEFVTMKHGTYYDPRRGNPKKPKISGVDLTVFDWESGKPSRHHRTRPNWLTTSTTRPPSSTYSPYGPVWDRDAYARYMYYRTSSTTPPPMNYFQVQQNPWHYYRLNGSTTSTTTTTQRPRDYDYWRNYYISSTTTTPRPATNEAWWRYYNSLTSSTTQTPWTDPWSRYYRPTTTSTTQKPATTTTTPWRRQPSGHSGSANLGAADSVGQWSTRVVRVRARKDLDPVQPVDATRRTAVATARARYNPAADHDHQSRVRQRQQVADPQTIHPFAYYSNYVGSTTCDQGSCYPATGNLLVGREEQLSATSTCGLRKPERFCIVSHLKDRKKCFICDSRVGTRHKQSHRIENIVSKPGKRKEFWWQSDNGVEHVSIQLDLEAEFHFTHLIMTFKTFRPSALLIERSHDFGLTWKVYRYFAYDCAESFPGIPIGQPVRITDVTCESRYSSVAPSTEGEVIFRVLNPYIRIENPYSEEVQNLLKMTNLRVNFTKLHTLGDDLVDNREEIKEKYYYAVYDMVVRGSCSCYGHASRCVELPGSPQRPDMVHGRCECTHNTKGLNCEHCEDFYNDLPWRPAFGRSSNACKKCNCNEHSSRCHLDLAVYEATGRVSGGVCDDCEHNTMGRNCERCKPFYYQDTSRRIEDPNICQPCDCDPRGSLDDANCDSVTDARSGLEAGRCHCKENVDGRRCDHCKNGFYNFDENNPVGCQSCTCDLKGTVENQGCNPYTGECICKRNVLGRDCNQCMAQFWGLSEDRDGCQACDCDPGGARDNNCDIVTGQCRCRQHVIGRRCDHPEQGYFSGMLDYLTYEAELSRGSSNVQVVVREPNVDRETTWTGLGFMRIYENSHLEFEVDNIQTAMEYDLVIRYEPQLSGRWEDVKVFIERPGPIDNRAICINTSPRDDIKQVTLPPGNRHVVVASPVCLEGNKRYKIRLEFRRYDPVVPTPSATLLIDSIVLLPRVDGIPFFKGGPVNDYRRQDFERYRCGQAFTSVVKQPVADVCKQHLFSIGLFVYGEAIECSCDPTGSVSSICDPYGGQCQCKPNVVGRRCDRCAPGTYGFSPAGCSPCDCNSVGAQDNFCNLTTGGCNCRPNTYGRQCDECRPGYWNYPSCRPCECNGHAERCDSRTGQCIECRDYSSGAHCDVCESGFYGDPRSGYNINCRPCPCPGVPGGGHSYAATCSLDPRTQNVVCNCEPGHAGERCDRCANNYYGNPQVPGGRCQLCQCNNNIDIIRPNNCDASTGQCLQCLFNTEGFFCERCKPGHWGDAINQNCIECNCDILGTDITINGGFCDSQNGQCPCLKNVEGMSCDRCKPNHWKLASGEGCEACDCDPLGSYAEQCNEFDGQCSCKQGFGGRRCDQCEATFWGDPRVRCQPCDCDRSGSETLQCHRNNGTCICRPGIGGDKCNMCARGYIGQAPYCNPCGECFDNWDFIINRLREETYVLVEQAKAIKKTGVTGLYTEQFADMDKKLDQVRTILSQANVTTADIEVLQEMVDELRLQLTGSGERLDTLDGDIDNTTQRIFDANQQLASLQAQTDKLQRDAKELEANATDLQEQNIEGALNITKEAWNRSRAAQHKVNDAEETLRESERERRRTEVLMSQAEGEFNRTYGNNEKALDELENDIARLQAEIPGINDDVCDGHGDPCSSLCGGALCGKCGGLSCNDGAVTKAENALQLALDAEKLLKEKDAEATQLLNEVSKAKREADEANTQAHVAFEMASQARNRSGAIKDGVEDVINRIIAFLEDDDKAKPSDIRLKAEETLGKDIALRPEEITKLAKQINDTIAKLTNIDDILAETADDLAKTGNLKKRADLAKQGAVEVLGVANKVSGALDDAKEAQDRAQKAIDKANGDIDATETDLAQIASETTAAQSVANKSVDDIEKLKERLANLRKKFVENELAVDQAKKAAQGADTVADKAKSGARDLERKYAEVTKKLGDKEKSSGDAKERARRLRERADALAQNATDKLNDLKDINNEFDLHEIKLRDLSDELMQLNTNMLEYMDVIEDRSNFYRDCTP